MHPSATFSATKLMTTGRDKETQPQLMNIGKKLNANYTPEDAVFCCCLRGSNGCLELHTSDSKHYYFYYYY